MEDQEQPIKKAPTKDKLDLAIEAFEDETSPLTLGERISLLRNALMFSSFNALKGEKHGKKGPNWEAEQIKREDYLKHFKDIEKLYASELKLNKITGKTEDTMTNDFLKDIKAMKSSVGSIVREL